MTWRFLKRIGTLFGIDRSHPISVPDVVSRGNTDNTSSKYVDLKLVMIDPRAASIPHIFECGVIKETFRQQTTTTSEQAELSKQALNVFNKDQSKGVNPDPLFYSSRITHYTLMESSTTFV